MMRIQFLPKLSLLLLTPFLLVSPSKMQGQGTGRLLPDPTQKLKYVPLEVAAQGPPGRDMSLSPTTQGKIQTVTPTALGTSPNYYSTVTPLDNNLAVDDSTRTVVFVHRNNPAVNGGAGTGLRYDISTNNGFTWTADIGVLNPIYLVGRYPQIAFYSPPGNTNPANSRVVFTAENLDGSLYRGFDYGVNMVQTTNPLPTAQNALFLPNAYHQSTGGMCEGRKGEYWAARITANTLQLTDSLLIFKGVYNTGTQSVTWSLANVKVMPWSLSYDGFPHAISPTVAFSPDGNTGWIALLGDLTAGPDSIFAPILLKTTDGGNTWGNPQEVNLNSIPWVADTLQNLWEDGAGQPYSTGRATTGFEYDLTVDATGNPHMLFVMGSATTTFSLQPDYSIFIGLAKYAVDLSSTDLGNTYSLSVVSPTLAFRGSFGSPIPVTQDHYLQISRDFSGSHIFYSWVDTDSTVYGLGNTVNDHPNLFIAGRRISDNYWTCMRKVTSGDATWDGFALTPQMAPEVFDSTVAGMRIYSLPIVMQQMTSNNPTSPTQHYYFGGDAILTEADFIYAPTSRVYWFGCDLLLSAPDPSISQPLQVYPHPVAGSAKLVWESWNGKPWQFELMDVQGRQLALQSQIHAAEWVFERGLLPAGLYVYRVTNADGQQVSGKMVLE